MTSHKSKKPDYDAAIQASVSYMATVVKSKTVWLNSALLLVAIIPPVTEWITANAIEATGILAMLNVLGKVMSALVASLTSKDIPTNNESNGNNTPGGGGSTEVDTSSITDAVRDATDLSKTLSILLVIGSIACLSSCRHAISYSPEDGLRYRDPVTGRDVQIILSDSEF